MHVNVGAGSYLEINIPMTVAEHGKLPRASLFCMSRGEPGCKQWFASSSELTFIVGAFFFSFSLCIRDYVSMYP